MADPTAPSAGEQAQGSDLAASPVATESPAGREAPESPERPEGTLPPEVHPAVKEERERAKRYRQMLEQLAVLDEHGNIVDLRPEIVEFARSRVPGGAGTAQPAAAADVDEAYRARLQAWAERMGMLPEQVDGVVTLARAIAEQIVAESTAPVLEASIESVRANLLSAADVPKEAVPFVSKWFETARRLNPKALLTPQGRETVLRQALGEFYLQQARGRMVPAGGGVPAPAVLRPAPGPQAGPTPTAEEQEIRRKLGLPPTYTELTPREIE